MQTTFLTVGIACLIAAAAGGGLTAFGIAIPVLSSLTRQLVLGILGAAFVGMSIWLTPIPPLPPLKIEITSPKGGEAVDYEVVVRGTISGTLPARLTYLWGFVTPVSGDYQAEEKWWPQSRITPAGEGWDIHFEIGDKKEDIGKDKEYLLAVFLLTSEVDASLWDYKSAWDPNNPLPYQLTEFLRKGQVQTCRIIKVIRK
jgi:hypothetical protein